MRGKFIVVSGPSGVGKGSICSRIIKDLNAWYSVSMTTRNPRDGEVDGKDYYFVSKEEFEDKISKNGLLEYNIYNGNYYGTPKDKVIEKLVDGINVFTEVDVNGARKIKEIYPDSLLIYIAPPSYEELKKRLIQRNTESIDTIEKRLEIAKEEMQQIHFYDYIIVNDDFEDAVNKVKNIINKE